jgi:hypothetical protein
MGNWINIDRGWINARSMAWSPSGKYLLIYGEIYLMSISLQGLRVIIVDIDSGNVAYNFSSEASYWGFDRFTQFAFSPDGTKIFFANASSSYLSSAILAANLDGTGLSKIVDFNVTSMGDVLPQVSIDVTSTGLLVYSFCQRTGYANYTSYIWKYNLATGEKSLVLKLNGSDAIITSLKVSPSNDKIAFATCKNICTVNLDGMGSVNVTNVSGGKIATWVDWTPNGTKLTYSEVAGSVTDWGLNVNFDSWRGNITAVNADGSNKHVILNDGYGLVWSPVGNSVAAYIKMPYMGSMEGYPYLIDFNMPITSNPDSDGDGLSDSVEIQNFLNPLDPTDIYKDYDEDGLTNLEEINYGTYIGNTDCDSDGLSDGVEVKVFKTNPTKADTDGDGVSDGLEAAATGLKAFIYVLPEGWIRMTLEWKNKTMYVSTNSSVLGVVFNSTSMALSISVGGPDGSTGIANITIPIEMVNSLSNVKVTLDNQPIDFQISQVGNNAQIYVQYHHSYHKLTAHLQGGGGIGGGDFTGILSYWWLILSVVIVAAASVIALIIIKRR